MSQAPDDLILVTGASGKVGRAFVARLRQGNAPRLRLLTYSQTLPGEPGVEVLQGTLSDPAFAARAVAGVTHVVHLATCKEDPDRVMDVSVKGLFHLLQAAREAKGFRRFLLLGGDAAVGHYTYAYPAPITETAPRMAYEGVYALSKVLEEVMVEQYAIQYGMDTCILRAAWIMEKDDFRCVHSFGPDHFGDRAHIDAMGVQEAARLAAAGAVPLLIDRNGAPLRRNFVHLDDVVSALVIALHHPRAKCETFNIAMAEPVDYAALSDILARDFSLPSRPLQIDAASNWLDVAKARLILGWRPEVDLHRLVHAAWTYRRASGDARVLRYVG